MSEELQASYFHRLSDQPEGTYLTFFDESNQTFGAVMKGEGEQGIALGTTPAEHPTVHSLMQALNDHGFSVSHYDQQTLSFAEMAMGSEEGSFEFVGVEQGGEARLGLMTPDKTLVFPEQTGLYSPDGPNWSYRGSGSMEASAVMLERAMNVQPNVGDVRAMTADITAGLPREWSMPVRDVAAYSMTGEMPAIQSGGALVAEMKLAMAPAELEIEAPMNSRDPARVEGLSL